MLKNNNTEYITITANNVRHFFISLILMIFLAISAQQVRAEIMEYTDAEKVGFAFYQLVNAEPDFQAWIKNSDKYKEASPVEKNQMLNEDETRLRNAFYHYIPDQDLIEINFTGVFHASNYFGRGQSEGVTTNVQILFDDIPQKFVPFQVGEMWIAVVPQDIEKLTKQNLNAEEYSEIGKKIGFDKRVFALKENVNIKMRLRPLSADAKEPVILQELPMWLMLAEIASFEVWIEGPRGKRTYAIEHFADWYVPSEQKQILHLYNP